jgi:hypothetical protein
MVRRSEQKGGGTVKGGYFLNSGVLFNVAISAYERLKSAPTDKTGNQNNALVAVLFSAATLEAFVMELGLMAKAESAMSGHKPLRSVAEILDEAEASRASTRLKFLLAKAVLGGETYETGSQPYQDFDILFAMRDAIIHLKPERITGEPHRIIERLRAKDLCKDEEPGVTASWLGQISTRSVARWACNVVVDMFESLKSCLPAESENTPLFSFFLDSRYKRIE